MQLKSGPTFATLAERVVCFDFEKKFSRRFTQVSADQKLAANFREQTRIRIRI
jgi:hypothetical protein